MPKTRARSGSEKNAGAASKPYAREAQPRATRPSSQTASSSKVAPAIAHSKLLAEIDAPNKMSTTNRSDRRKRRRSAVHLNEAADAIESDGEPNGAPNGTVNGRSSPTPGPSAQSPTKRTREFKVEVHVPHGYHPPTTLPDAQKELDRERSEHKDTRRNLKEAMHSLRKQTDRADKADQTEKALRDQLKELQKELEEQKQQVSKQTEDLETKAKSKHHDEIKDGLTCTVCMDVFNDPHVLSCGHAACLRCLVQWFRSGNAYRGEDIDIVAEFDDLTYRTKLCFKCRHPIVRRPIRMFDVRAVIESLGLGPTSPVEERNDDPWALSFPPDPQTYLITDDKDGVDRCPLCGCEVALGRCEGCDTMFSDEDGDYDDDLDDDMSEGSGMGYQGAFDLVVGLRNFRGAMRDLSPLSVPDSSDYSEPDLGELDPNTFHHPHPVHHHPNLDLIDDIADESDVDYWSGSEDWGNREPLAYRSDSEPHHEATSENGSRSPSPAVIRPYGADRHRHRPRSMSLSVASDYESSFIDDEELDDEEAEVAPPSPEPQPDAPNMDELRNRRAARFGRAPPRDASPIPRRNARRGRNVVVVSDDDE